MIIKQVKCDICGKVTDFVDHETIYLNMTLKPVYHSKYTMAFEASNLGDLGFTTADESGEMYKKNYDMCSNCVRKFVSFLNNEDAKPKKKTR